MPEEVFTDAEADVAEEWVDVRMTDPEEGEWDVDVVVASGRVEYVDLRVKPELLASFVDCLVDDVGDERAAQILSTVADQQDLDIESDDIESGDAESGDAETER